MDEQWLSQCRDEKLVQPILDRKVYVLDNYIIKKQLSHDERGHNGYVPIYSAVKQRDANEILALKLVQEYTSIPVPKVVHSGNGYVYPRSEKITSIRAITNIKLPFLDSLFSSASQG